MKQNRIRRGAFGELPLAVIRFSVPLMFTGIFQLLYNTADSVIVGRSAGYASLAAVGSTASLVSLLVSLFNGVAVGANYLTARYYGAKDREAMSQTVHCAALLSIILGAAAGIIGFVFSTPLLRLMNTDPEVLPLASVYLKIYFLGIPALVVYNFGSAILRAIGDTTSPFIFIVISGAVNVLLNLLLVMAFHMDVAGVAVATAVSQLLSAVMVAIRLVRLDGPCRLVFSRIRFYKDKAREMMSVGLAAGLQGAVFSVANVMVQSQVNTFGSEVMAGNVAANTLENFIHMGLNSFYQAAITFTSRSLGAGNPRQARAVFRVTMALTAALGIVLCTILRLFEVPLLSIYVKKTDPAYDLVMAAGLVRVAAIGQFQWVGGLMETASGSIRGYGKSMNSTVTTLAGACGLRILWIYTVFAHYGTILSLYIAIPVSWVVTFLVHYLFYRLYARRAEQERTAA